MAESAQNARRLDRASGAVEFRKVSFAYDTARPVLQDVSSRLPPGTASASRARPGAGKTTLIEPAHALLRSDVGPDPAGRRGSPRLPGGRPAQAVRDRAAGAGPVLDEHRREHRLRAARTPRGGDRGRRHGGERPRLHRRAARGIRHAGRASAACGSRVGSASESRSRARS